MKTNTLLPFLCFILFLYSCQSSKKLNYDNAYRFSLPDRYIGEHKENRRAEEASDKVSTISAPAPESLSATTALDLSIHPTEKEPLGTTAKSTNVERKSEDRKVHRQELKKLIKAYKKDLHQRTEVSGAKDKQANWFVKGLVLVIVGLLLIVGGIVLINPIGLILGSVIAGVGLIVFLIGFLGLVL